jgi:hypothetical protein
MDRIEQDSLKLLTLKILFYPAYPVHPVKISAALSVDSAAEIL